MRVESPESGGNKILNVLITVETKRYGHASPAGTDRYQINYLYLVGNFLWRDEI